MTSLGPLPMPVALVVMALLLAMGMAALWARRRAGPTAPSAAGLLLDTLLIGLLCGRISFVLFNLRAYLDAPMSLLKITDGGYHWPVVLLAGIGWVLWRLRAHPVLRLPVLSAGLLGTLAWAAGSAGLSSWQARHMALPAVQVVDLQGRAVPLQQFQGKPLVLNLWASWCAPCRREMPVLQAAQQAHPGVQFVFANQGERLDEVQGFLAAEQLSLGNVLLDADAATSSALGVQAYPSTLFFDGQGRMVELHLGELTAAGLDHKLRRLR